VIEVVCTILALLKRVRICIKQIVSPLEGAKI